MESFKAVMKLIRYIVILASAGWAGACAAFSMWGEMIFFLAYMIAIYVLGIIVDRYHSP